MRIRQAAFAIVVLTQSVLGAAAGFLPEDDPGPAFDPLRPIGKPEGIIVTRDQFSPPVSDGRPPWADMLGEPDCAKPMAKTDFGPVDPAYDPWNEIVGYSPSAFLAAFRDIAQSERS